MCPDNDDLFISKVLLSMYNGCVAMLLEPRLFTNVNSTTEHYGASALYWVMQGAKRTQVRDHQSGVMQLSDAEMLALVKNQLRT